MQISNYTFKGKVEKLSLYFFIEGGRIMKLINKSRGTGKTTQLIYASAITGFRIIAPTYAMAKHIEKMARTLNSKIGLIVSM